MDFFALVDRPVDVQKTFTDNFGLTRQSKPAIINKEYVIDYTNPYNRDLAVYEEGSYVTSYTYGLGLNRISQTVMNYPNKTEGGIEGQNSYTDLAVEKYSKLYFHQDRLGSTIRLTRENGTTIAWADYDEWGKPRSPIDHDMNMAGVDNAIGFTSYTYDVVLDKFFAQARMYDANSRRFMASDSVKDGTNWYAYCGNSPVAYVDPLGLYFIMKDRVVLSSHLNWYGDYSGTYSVVPDDYLATALDAAFQLVDPTGVISSVGTITTLPSGDIVGGTSMKILRSLDDLAESIASVGLEKAAEAAAEHGGKILQPAGAVAGKVLSAASIIQTVISTSDRLDIVYRDTKIFRLMEMLNLPTTFQTQAAAEKQMAALERVIDLNHSYVFEHMDMRFKVETLFDMDYALFNTCGDKRASKIKDYANSYADEQHGWLASSPSAKKADAQRMTNLLNNSSGRIETMRKLYNVIYNRL